MKKIAFLKRKREWNEEKIEIGACIFSTFSIALLSAESHIRNIFISLLFIRNFPLQFFFSLFANFVITFNFSAPLSLLRLYALF